MYRFYLDGQLQNTEDLNWENIKFGLKRFEDFNALFFEYATGLELTGGAYQYIVQQNQALGVCGQVGIIVEYRCNDVNGQFENIFEGIINLSDIEEDLFNCKIMCEAEDNSFSALLVALKDEKTPITASVSKGGATITPTLQYNVDQTGFGQFRPMYLCVDTLTFLLRYITDRNSAVINSTLFSTAQTRHRIDITFTNTAQLTGSGNIVITYKNPFNQTITVTSPKQGTVLGTLRRIVYDLRGTSPPANATQLYYSNEWIKPNFVEQNGTNQVRITFNAPFSITNVTGAAFTLTTVSNSVRGAYGLMLNTGSQMRGVTPAGVPELSFDDVFSELNKIYNLGFTLRTVAGVPTMRLEHISFFFANSGLISVMDIPGIMRRRSTRFAKDNIKVGDGGKKQGLESAVNRKETWYGTSGTCSYDNPQDCQSSWVTDHERGTLQRTSTDPGEDSKIFLLETRFNVAGGYFTEKEYLERIYTNPSSGASVNVDIRNAGICNYWKVINWLFSSVGDMALGTKTFINTSVPKFVNEFKFKAPLKYGDFKTLKANETNFIEFSPTQLIQDGYIGWIDEIEYDNRTSETEFTLITQ